MTDLQSFSCCPATLVVHENETFQGFTLGHDGVTRLQLTDAGVLRLERDGKPTVLLHVFGAGTVRDQTPQQKGKR